MDELRDDAEYAVFDDISGGFKFFPNYKGWLGCQAEFTVTDKYRAKRKFKWGKPSIMLMNSNPADDPHVDYEWFGRKLRNYLHFRGTPLVSNVRANTQ